jgi:DNA-binding IscR family transcriptional regulator
VSILRAQRGPHGGYELICECCNTSIGDILRDMRLHDMNELQVLNCSVLLQNIVAPAMAEAEQAFGAAVSTLSLDGLLHRGFRPLLW